MKIILHSDDINLLAYCDNALDGISLIYDDIGKLKSINDSVVIINFTAFNGTQKELIQALTKRNNLVFVLDRTPNMQKAKEVLSYGAKAYGNALMKGHLMRSAIETIKDHMIWLHPELISKLITQIVPQENKNIDSLLQELSTREKEVALLLKDGDTYKEIALNLGITPRTIKAHAQSIYTKLHIKDRLALALLLK